MIQEILVPFITLSAMEIVLGIDNIVFISILVSKLPQNKQDKARTIGLTLALVLRLGMLLGISKIMTLTSPFLVVKGHPFSGRDLILLIGGLFLIWKSTREIHDKIEVVGQRGPKLVSDHAKYGSIIAQIIVIDLVFSLDSVITAVGMAQSVAVMIAAMVTAVFVMMASAKGIGGFVERHPTVKMLALSFLILIGVMLVAEGMGQHIEKGYIYFAMAFSLAVEFLNIRARKA